MQSLIRASSFSFLNSLLYQNRNGCYIKIGMDKGSLQPRLHGRFMLTVPSPSKEGGPEVAPRLTQHHSRKFLWFRRNSVEFVEVSSH